jgi:Flp pilus assembly protein TadG
MSTVEKLPHLMRTLQRDEQGSIMAWSALGIASLLGVAALTVDMGYMYVVNNQLQTTADAAASAAVKELPDQTAALAAAQNIVLQNMPSAAHGNVITAPDVQFGNWDTGTRTFTQGGSPTNAVRVNARRDNTNSNAVNTFFASVLGYDDVSIGASATATQGTEATQPGCLISLDPSSNQAFTVDDNAVIDLDGCGVKIKSTSPSALSLVDNANVQIDGEADICIRAPGSYDQTALTTLDPTPVGCQDVTDPLAGIALPNTAGACTWTNRTINIGVQTWSPGIYCGGMTLNNSATVNLNPGLYILKNSANRTGSLNVNSTATLTMANPATNTGVLIYLTGTYNGAPSVLNISANSRVTLKATQTAADATALYAGAVPGVLIIQDPNDPAYIGAVNTLASNSNMQFNGAIYTPQSDLVVMGNAAGGSISSGTSCSIFIARRFTFNQSAGFTGTYDVSTGCPAALASAMGGSGGSGSGLTTLVK